MGQSTGYVFRTKHFLKEEGIIKNSKKIQFNAYRKEKEATLKDYDMKDNKELLQVNQLQTTDKISGENKIIFIIFCREKRGTIEEVVFLELADMWKDFNWIPYEVMAWLLIELKAEEWLITIVMQGLS